MGQSSFRSRQNSWISSISTLCLCMWMTNANHSLLQADSPPATTSLPTIDEENKTLPNKSSENFIKPGASNPVDILAQDSNAFSFELLKKAAGSVENVVFAPYSIFSCLSMVYAGAKGKTADQIRQVLSLHGNAIEIAHASFSLRNSLITSSREGCGLRFSSSNGLFADQDTFILSSFRELVQKNYQAEIAALNFKETDKSLMTINGWVSNETKGKIPQLLYSGDVNPSTRLILVNAAYFQGKWFQPFDPKATQQEPFHITDERDIQVPMMHLTDTFSYFENDLAQILSLPFQTCDLQDPHINCLLVLPKSATDLQPLEQQFTPALFRDWANKMEPTKVNVQIPRFCMKKRFDLNSLLTQMGMTDAFNDKADFSGINGMHDLFLSKMIHEAYFSLNEYGVEAAAATSAIINAKAVQETKPPVLFAADHPFYFFLMDRQTQTILFAGKIFQPDTSTCP